MSYERETIVTGGDPRAFAEYQTLVKELAKQQHPARPDIDWQQVEQTALRLFKHHGIDLQSAVWYGLARAHRQQLAGLLEGVNLLQALLAYQWSRVWPEKIPQRLTILLPWVKQLQQLLRTWHYHAADVNNLQALQQTVTVLLSQLSQHFELPSEFSSLRNQIDNVLAALAQRGYLPLPAASLTSVNATVASHPQTADASPLVFVANSATDKSLLRQRWQVKIAFLTGMLTMTMLLAMGYSVQHYYYAPAWQKSLFASVAPLPKALPLAKQQQWQTEKADQLAKLAPVVLTATQRQLAALQAMPLLWRQQYSWQLLQQTARFWPDKALDWQLAWQKQLQANQFSRQELAIWQQANQRLDQLMQQLNQADNHPRRYLTVSQLKTALFAISQPLQRSQPVEELLRQLAQQQQQGKVSPRLTQKIDDQINKILNSYFVLTHPLEQ